MDSITGEAQALESLEEIEVANTELVCHFAFNSLCLKIKSNLCVQIFVFILGADARTEARRCITREAVGQDKTTRVVHSLCIAFGMNICVCRMQMQGSQSKSKSRKSLF